MSPKIARPIRTLITNDRIQLIIIFNKVLEEAFRIPFNGYIFYKFEDYFFTKAVLNNLDITEAVNFQKINNKIYLNILIKTIRNVKGFKKPILIIPLLFSTPANIIIFKEAPDLNLK